MRTIPNLTGVARFHPLACFAVTVALGLGACATTTGQAPSVAPGEHTAVQRLPPSASVFNVTDVDVRPKARTMQRPQFPALLRRNGISGQATIDLIVGPDGNVYDAFIAGATSPEFGQAALEAVERWTFSPGLKTGRAVWTRIELPIRFEINQGG